MGYFRDTPKKLSYRKYFNMTTCGIYSILGLHQYSDQEVKYDFEIIYVFVSNI